MYKIKISGLFLMGLVLSTSSIADSVFLYGKTNKFHCTTVVPTTGDVPTVKIDTYKENVRGLCVGGNSINGQKIGNVSQGGHLTGFPVTKFISDKKADGSDYTLNDICFNTEADSKISNGRVDVLPESGAIGVQCSRGCPAGAIDFGVGGYC